MVFLFLVRFPLMAQFMEPLFIPDTLEGPVINLEIKASQKSFFSGVSTQTKAFNNQNFLGPTLIFRKGWNIQATVNNNLADTTTLHWHGLHLPAHADGGPHSPILPGGQWNAHFFLHG
jgi:blue copper oxidase